MTTNVTITNATATNTTATTTPTTATTTTITTFADKSLGIVSNCTLVGAKNISVHSGEYCAINIGEKSQKEAYSQCKALNALLPLPKNEAEVAAFLKISPNNTWIGIMNPTVRGRNI